MSRCRRTLRSEGHSATGWGIVGLSSCYCGSKVCSFEQCGRPLTAPRRLLLVLVSTPLRIVNRCYSGFSVRGGI